MENAVDLLRRVPTLKVNTQQNLEKLAETLTHREFARGEVLVTKGDQGSSLFMIKSGEVAVSKSSHEPIKMLKDGDYFGEVQLLAKSKRFATVTATRPTRVLILHSLDLLSTVPPSPELIELRKTAAGSIKKIPLFEDMELDKRASIVAVMFASQYKKDDYICRQGNSGDSFFVILAGHAMVTINTGGKEKKIATLGPGDYVGEMALLQDNGKRSANVISTVDGLVCMTISRSHFTELMGSLIPHLLKVGGPRLKTGQPSCPVQYLCSSLEYS